ncbi:MAG: transcriptional repressor LexA [Candidatus Moranbacteria bacterium]|nr:transcriptional repressor LexA [Candidatus Moranbacteria bacterium]
MSNRNSKTLTPKQKRVFDHICDCLEKSALSPTIAELARFLGVSSLRTVTQYLESLEKKGLIVRSHHQSRGIRLAGYNDLMQETVTLPVVSAAGCDNMNVFAEQSYDEFITLDRDFIKGHDSEKVVIFRAMGDSMVDAGIETGDLVLTEMTTDIRQKDKVVAIVDGMALIKQINFSANAVILSPMSPDPQYRPIIMKRNFQVFGKVVDVIKNSFGGEELTYESF